MAAGEEKPKPISLFFSYSHKDERYRENLETQLKILQRQGVIEGWHDRKIGAGKDWASEIDHHLETAAVILLLVSENFLASGYCYSKEMTRALERHESGSARVIPIILRHCLWEEAPFAKLQALPRDGKPITRWTDRTEAYKSVAVGIREAARELRAAAHPHPSPLPQAGEGGRDPHPSPLPQAGEGVKGAAASPSPAARERAGVRVFKDSEAFRDVDAPWCPEMVVMPAGEFLMGSPEKEVEGYNAEPPKQTVTIGTRFALGRYPVTVGEYRLFVKRTGHRNGGRMYAWTGSEWKEDATKNWLAPGFVQTDRHPVVGVSWHDALTYCEWLARGTSQPYRLPSEAEWEYAACAGTTRRYSVGDQIGDKDANFRGKTGTTEVGTYPPNPWGLYDMYGNVRQIADNVSHGRPVDPAMGGRAGATCPHLRVYRRASTWFIPITLPAAARVEVDLGFLDVGLGFRVARTLS